MNKMPRYVKCRICGTVLGEWKYLDCEPPRFELCISCSVNEKEKHKTESEILEDEWNEMVSVYE